MKKILLVLLTLVALSPLYSATFIAEGDSFRLEGRNFSFDFPSSLLYFKGEHISYGRLDSLSLYSSLFNPYRKYHNTRLRVSKSKIRGLRGFLFSFDDFSLAFSTESALSFAFAYENPYFDASLIYYDQRKEDSRTIINNYKRGEKRDVYSLLLRAKYKSYLDLMGIFSYSSLLGIDGFYRFKGSLGPLSLSLSYGNTFLSSSDELFSISFDIHSQRLDFAYQIKYSESSIYTDFFRSYSSSYSITLKYNGARLILSRSFSFDQSANVSDKKKISIFYKGISISLDSNYVINISFLRGNLEFGIGEKGSFIKYRFSQNFTLSYEGGKFDAILKFVF